MARSTTPRFVLNRLALDEVQRGYADGVFDFLRAVMRIAESRAPDATPYGEGLVDRGAAIVWTGKKRTHQVRTDGESATVPKPRGSTALHPEAISGIVGFGFPAMFQELGTVHHPAQPFLTPSVAELAPQAGIMVARQMARRLRGERDPRSAQISARIAARRAAKAAQVSVT